MREIAQQIMEIVRHFLELASTFAKSFSTFGNSSALLQNGSAFIGVRRAQVNGSDKRLEDGKTAPFAVHIPSLSLL